MRLIRTVPSFTKSLGLIAGLVLVLISTSYQAASAQSGSQVSYSINPAASSVQSGGSVSVTVTLHNQVPFGGGSLHLAFNQGAYVTSESANNADFTFVYYHQNFNDLVFICANNTCAPGSHEIATITMQAGSSGTMSVNFTPKETVDPDRNPLQATGATGTYDILASAPATVGRQPSGRSGGNNGGNVITVPQDSDDGSPTPFQITNDQFQEKVDQAQKLNNALEDEDTTSFWTPRNIILLGLAVGIGFAAFMFFLLKFFNRDSGPRGPYSSGGNGPGPQAIVG